MPNAPRFQACIPGQFSAVPRSDWLRRHGLQSPACARGSGIPRPAFSAPGRRRLKPTLKPEPMPIVVDNLTFSYERTTEAGVASIFNQFSCSFGENKVHAILGPSGCGKTTFLNLLSGILTPTSRRSTITIDGMQPANALKDGVLAYLPQIFYPAPWRTVSENVEFAISLAHPSEPNSKENADALLRDLHLADLGHRYPRAISGGQLRRLTLAMCVAVRPKYLLLDEPFSALDLQTK